MTLENLYQEIGGNYANIMERLLQEERIKKFVLLFLKDNSHQLFIQALEQGTAEEAFRALSLIHILFCTRMERSTSCSGCKLASLI